MGCGFVHLLMQQIAARSLDQAALLDTKGWSAVLCCAVLCCAVLCWAVLGWQKGALLLIA